MDTSNILFIIKFLIESLISDNLFIKSLFDLTTNRQLDNFLTNINRTHINPTAEINIKIYTGFSYNTATVINIPINNSNEIYQNINHNKPTSMYIHGYRERATYESIHRVIGAYLEQNTDNILLVEWSHLAEQEYVNEPPEIKDIARTITKTLDRLIDLGFNLNTFHLVGHSLGALIAGFIGKNSKYTLPRITVLEPARPLFPTITEYIDNDSAKFIDVLHTDSGFYGSEEIIGAANFFANGGKRPQPGCPLLAEVYTIKDSCHHFRAWELWAESVRSPQAFASTLCLSYLQYLVGDCRNNEVVYFGPSLSKNALGFYFFNTKGRSPFGNSSEFYNRY